MARSNLRTKPIWERLRTAALFCAAPLALLLACTGTGEGGGSATGPIMHSADPAAAVELAEGLPVLYSRAGEGAATFDYTAEDSVSVFLACPGGSCSITVDLIDEKEMAPAACDSSDGLVCRMRFVQDQPQTLKVSIAEDSDSWVFVIAEFPEQ